jgi:hypothetical protein
VKKRVIHFPRGKSVPPESIAEHRSRVVVNVGAQRYALDISCTATRLSTANQLSPGTHIETKFLHLRKPVSLGDRIDGWRVCWLGGWDKGKLFYVVMVERAVPTVTPKRTQSS